MNNGEERLARTLELQKLKRICREIAKGKEVEDEELTLLSKSFGATRFRRALETVENKRVKKYIFRPGNRIVWIVVGKKRDYLIMPAADFCTCDDFYFRVMDQQVHLCYHLIAQKLAEALGNFDFYEEDAKLYDVLMAEWKKQ